MLESRSVYEPDVCVCLCETHKPSGSGHLAAQAPACRWCQDIWSVLLGAGRQYCLVQILCIALPAEHLLQVHLPLLVDLWLVTQLAG
ncbi:hypothetical protein KOW79_020507 [Hemibagrus wyckioides]|uniref:Uncharacterized protein n=1 Tax=Hemibagrus wyckioides TaxID=337641 RepID=A0A9D3N318_9TELE|nr:hypothetical protein KOW79_020507 [Hemibagrus wyckioides]